jgi:hypothetical protein
MCPSTAVAPLRAVRSPARQRTPRGRGPSLVALGLAAAAVSLVGPVRPAAGQAAPPPAEFRTGDGRLIPIQREWVQEVDPASVQDEPADRRPYRFNQRYPKLVHTEQRTGRRPIYYFQDVRWRQEDSKGGPRPVLRAYYTSVRVDMEKVKGAYLCIKPFAPRFLAGHAAVLLEMDPAGFTNLDGQDGGGFVLSYEAWMRVGQKYGLLAGQMGKYPIVYVVSTWADFLYKSIHMDDSEVKRWKLALSHGELQELELAIGKAVVADHSEERYNTMRHSCVTAALDLINASVPPERRARRDWLGGLMQNPAWTLPVFTDRALRRKGLIVGEMEVIREAGAAAAAP